jgi:hypothetical protein
MRDAYKKIRKTWEISPVTKVKKSKKKYCKSLTKQDIEKILQEEDM